MGNSLCRCEKNYRPLQLKKRSESICEQGTDEIYFISYPRMSVYVAPTVSEDFDRDDSLEKRLSKSSRKTGRISI